MLNHGLLWYVTIGCGGSEDITYIVVTILIFLVQCTETVASYGPMIISMIIQKEDPQVLCTQLDLCSNGSSIAVAPVVPAPSTDDIECVLCQVCIFIFWELIVTLLLVRCW